VGKNVAVFVDVANIFYAAKAAGVDIDYVTLLKSATAGRDFVRAYAYTGLDPENENQRNFHSFLARNNYKVVSKDIRKYGDGKVKANLDIELVVDLMKTARNLDVAIVVSGDGDFAPAIRAVQEMGVRVEVISFRGNTSSDLIEVADLFTDITALAKVEKGTRSGRRVADDEQDLSMTEVPDKQTEGTGTGRGRGRTPRGRGRAAEPAAATRRRSGPAADEAGGGALVAMPGEKLSKAGSAADGDADVDEEATDAVVGEPLEEGADGDGRRRRRRRGGRGRGRGRGRERETELTEAAGDEADDLEPEDLPAAARGPRPTPFGSVWDSQLGVPAASAGRPPVPAPGAYEEDDFEEPEIPEYLIAEQRRGARSGGRAGAGGGGGGRGGRGRAAYAAAIDRERYGRGGGGGGINRYPDVSGRSRGGRPESGFGREPRPERRDRPARSDEPWSEVPAELEEMLRSQLAASGKAAPPPAAGLDAAGPTAEVVAPTAPAAPKRRPTRSKATSSTTAAAAGSAPAVEAGSSDSAGDADSATPAKPRTTRTRSTATRKSAGTSTTSRRTTTRKSTAAAGADESAGQTSDTSESSEGDDGTPAAKPTTTRRRSTRKKTDDAG
jgi:uncharacterized LabA/DUF88 family protein